jgi:hypothetical protein
MKVYAWCSIPELNYAAFAAAGLQPALPGSEVTLIFTTDER